MTRRSADLISVGFVVGVCAVLLAPATAAATGVGTDGPRPVIEVRERRQDGGVVEEGTVVPFRFEVENRGQADLEVTQVKTSCGCTVAKWDRVIPPGAHGTIDAQMSTLYFHGAVTKHLSLFSNDPARPQVELTITARLLPLVKISPDPTALLEVGEKAATQEFVLERNGGHPMKLVQVIPYAPYIKAETTPLSGQGRYKLTVTAMPDAPLGRSTVPVVVWTDLEKAGIVTFVITVERGIVTVPAMILYGTLPHEMKTPPQAIVTIRRSSTPFHVKRVAVDDPHLVATLETVRDGAEYRVTVTYAGGWDAGPRRQTLTVTTDDPKQPVIQIPVQAVVQETIAHALPLVRH
jgi:Protein of unknown function (DUF1573)